MNKTQALKLVGESVFLAKAEDGDLRYDYYVWLSFVDEYKDVSYPLHKEKLRGLIEHYNVTQ